MWFSLPNRHDMTKPENFYWEDNIRRTLDDIRACCIKLEYSCERPPLLNIPVENIILDELHLMLRITGMIFTVYYSVHLISWDMNWEQKKSMWQGLCIGDTMKFAPATYPFVLLKLKFKHLVECFTIHLDRQAFR